MKRNTFILKCFLPFACANLDGSQKERGNFLNLLQKKGGSLRKRRGGSNPGGTMINHILTIINFPLPGHNDVFLYLMVRPFIFIDTIKTVTPFVTYTLCNNFIFIFNL